VLTIPEYWTRRVKIQASDQDLVAQWLDNFEVVPLDDKERDADVKMWSGISKPDAYRRFSGWLTQFYPTELAKKPTPTAFWNSMMARFEAEIQTGHVHVITVKSTQHLKGIRDPAMANVWVTH